MRLIETDAFPFEFVSDLAEHESWRKEIHRPIYHIHKWWANRLGSVFRAILLGATLPECGDLAKEFFNIHQISGLTVLDPFMGSGTTIGEAHKLGITALGRDINPVAVQSVRAALGPMDRALLQQAFNELSEGVGKSIRALYRSKDSMGRPCDTLYFFWVMQVPCLACHKLVDLFPSRVVARNAYPNRKPGVQILCPSCGDIFPGLHGETSGICPSCNHSFNPENGTAKGKKATCQACAHTFSILDSLVTLASRPNFRLFGKLVLTRDQRKEYLRATTADEKAYLECTELLKESTAELPTLKLKEGHNTRQAISYNFRAWRDFFNNRQLLALSMLRQAIWKLDDSPARAALLKVQDADPTRFADKLTRVFLECKRVLKHNGLLVFSYHHSRDEGWKAVAQAILGAGFVVVNSQPVKAEMSVAAPKAQAKDPIQLDIIIVCRRKENCARLAPSVDQATAVAKRKIERLNVCGFPLSRNDQRVVLFGQLLTTLKSAADLDRFNLAETEFQPLQAPLPDRETQLAINFQ